MKKKQKLPNIKKQNPLVPIDITKLGTNGDPCFGKQYDLSTNECRLCGDSELCAFKMSQTLNVTRKELDEKNHYKDLDLMEDVDGIKKYLRSLKRKGLSRKEIVDKAVHKYEVPKKDIRTIYRTLK